MKTEKRHFCPSIVEDHLRPNLIHINSQVQICIEAVKAVFLLKSIYVFSFNIVIGVGIPIIGPHKTSMFLRNPQISIFAIKPSDTLIANFGKDLVENINSDFHTSKDFVQNLSVAQTNNCSD